MATHPRPSSLGSAPHVMKIGVLVPEMFSRELFKKEINYNGT